MAQVYSAQAYNRMPQPPISPSSRRHPFTNAVNHLQNMNPQAATPKHQEKQKQPPSPPLPRQNAKITPPSPPKIICDKSGKFQFSRVGFLGEVCTFMAKYDVHLIITTGRICSCVRGQRSWRWTPGVQSRHQVITQDEKGKNQSKPPLSFPLMTFYNTHCSYMQKLRSIVSLNIRISCGSKNVLKITRMFI